LSEAACAVAVEGLEKRFGPVVALAGLDFAVPAGSVLAVLGPNGAGKSTLLRLLAGLARPSAGQVRIGAAQDGDRRRVRGRVGYVGHATFLYPNLTARENLLFAARLYGVAEPGRRADALLDEQGLEALSARPAGSFSPSRVCSIRRRARVTTSTPITAPRCLTPIVGSKTIRRQKQQPGSRRRTRSPSRISRRSRSATSSSGASSS